jgi:leucine dehydrogenase
MNMSSIDNLRHFTTSKVTNNFLDYANNYGFGDLHFKIDKATGMKAVIAIHSNKLGPALGGCRFIEYPNHTSAIEDAIRLARGMSYKAASVNLPLGGGKAVIIKPSVPFDRDAYFYAFGQFINDLGGRYITALDSGTQLQDMDIIAQHTPYVASLSRHNGDPSPSTAKGVLQGINAAVAFKLGRNNLEGLHVAIQGLGHVGYLLAGHLHKAGALLTVADINSALVKKAIDEFGAIGVATDLIHKVPCDVFSPCALGAIINDVTINQLQTSIIAGAANNQLAHHYHGKLLHDKGITYAVDYVANAGGLLFAAGKYLKTPQDEVNQKIDNIYAILFNIFEQSGQENKPTSEVADAIAEEKLAQ